MDFLIIGNGFDIAHNFPTRYVDFLKYCRNYDENNPVSSLPELNKEFRIFLTNNVWLEYFLDLVPDLESDRTWIDFEKEVASVVQGIEFGNWKIARRDYIGVPSETTIESLARIEPEKSLRFISYFCNYDKRQERFVSRSSDIVDFDSFVKFIYLQLRDFTRAFEIYCLKINRTVIDKPTVFSERGMQIKTVEAELDSSWEQIGDAEKHYFDNVNELKQIRIELSNNYNRLMSEIRPVDYLSIGRFTYVLSFNYTDTYERLYGDSQTKYCYIHGKAQENKERTNLILGIDDNLPDGKESSNFRCVRFKKYYQRILFKTGSEYKDWLALGPKQLSSTNYVHIVGHSLDRTDHDVLYEFFSDKRFRIIVYYYSQKDFEDKIQNVIRLLAYKGGNGRDELIRRVHGQQWTIKFVYLYDENEGLFKAPATTVDELQKVEV